MNRRVTAFHDYMPGTTTISSVTQATPKRENLLLSIVFNIVLGSLTLTYLSKPEALGPRVATIVALIFPLGYGIWDYRQRRQANFVSVIGVASILLTGGLMLLDMDAFWIAVKEAAIPAIIGLAVLFSMKSKRPLVREFLLNDQVIDLPKVEQALTERGTRGAFDRLLANSSYWLVASFTISAFLNFGLARYLLKSTPGTPEFNAEIARMQVLSWPVIVIPSMIMTMAALWYLISGLKKLTGLELEQMFHPAPEKK
ncbi:MAG TPA: VC0807 family protein [Opitutaceae bacterium]